MTAKYGPTHMSHSQRLIQKLWNYCNILRDDGLSYGDYVEQLTFLLFLKMADEQSKPPFNKPSAIPIVNEKGEQEKESLVVHRDDFWASTSNKQLNFLQLVFTILKQHGRAAVVVPDNVLFEGGAGETVRRELLKQADVHTLSRTLPTRSAQRRIVKTPIKAADKIQYGFKRVSPANSSSETPPTNRQRNC